MSDWQTIDSAPRTGRVMIELLVPPSPEPQIAYADTWWQGGFSAECRPTHWRPHSSSADAASSDRSVSAMD